MSRIFNISYSKNAISEIKEWVFGTNWPAVYIIYNSQKAYIGETLDLVRRTEQHLSEREFMEFTDICMISDKTFNKSVILDLESFLIKYMSADDSKELINGNAGVANHNYFYKEAYEDDFKEIWQCLISEGIVKKRILDIENSELFKYSPYKSLNNEQIESVYEILKNICKSNNASCKSMVKVTGGAGTGKTIVAVYLVKLLVDINKNKRVWDFVDNVESAILLKKYSEKIKSINKIGFVVPMKELRTTMKRVFKSIDGLNEEMVLAPEDVVKDYYDILIVDEAHRLYQRNHLPGAHLYTKFDRINEALMGDKIQRNSSDYAELDWIIRSSRMQVIFYDEQQTIRATDIDRERFDTICRPHLVAYYNLLSQMRCKGGNGYYDYVKTVLEGKDLTNKYYKTINNYSVKVCDSIAEFFGEINEKRKKFDLCQVVCGPGWGKEEKIIIENQVFEWFSNDVKENVILSIHKSQGFDLNYAGVIFGKEVYYDTTEKCIAINKQELKDNFTKSAGEEAMNKYLKNIYLTLMTRGINGTYIYAVDKNLREYLKMFFE